MGEFGDGGGFTYSVYTFYEKDGWAFFGKLDFVGDAFSAFDVTDEHLVDELFIDFGRFGDSFFLGFIKKVLDKLKSKSDSDIGFDEDLLKLFEIGIVDFLVTLGKIFKTVSKSGSALG